MYVSDLEVASKRRPRCQSALRKKLGLSFLICERKHNLPTIVVGPQSEKDKFLSGSRTPCLNHLMRCRSTERLIASPSFGSVLLVFCFNQDQETLLRLAGEVRRSG